MIPGSIQNGVRGFNEKPKNVPLTALHVTIHREIFMDYFTLVLDNGYSEELEPEDTRAWFKARGANMDAVEAALDQAWNFKIAEIYICNPKTPVVNKPAWAPKL